MSDDQWLKLWRKWCAMTEAARARYARMVRRKQEREPLPF